MYYEEENDFTSALLDELEDTNATSVYGRAASAAKGVEDALTDLQHAIEKAAEEYHQQMANDLQEQAAKEEIARLCKSYER